MPDMTQHVVIDSICAHKRLKAIIGKGLMMCM